ncbi:GNAT family N-acetyltransferase [Spirosoma taeanense]|uniref:GNAT family N-acetyltransferase n=1 Tax=Spirosoma taeanense TaxID=2735870 RepID=A0A6M5Y7B8_9BACT|nr:GNAT family N-acetyltransferase [Spirosoma taeanense]QJW89121.1 GNAT family N-acetyltransferase [Spirosoma taeanense]
MYIDCDLCVIRSWQRDDEQTLPKHANNREVWLNLRDRFPHPYTQADAQQWIESVVGAYPETGFAITVEGEAVGAIGLVLHDDIERCSAEVGYWLGQTYWGRGIITAALKAFTRYVFSEFELTRLYAVPFLRNPASIKVLEKAGYQCEGIMRRSAIKDGQIIDQALYACIAGV